MREKTLRSLGATAVLAVITIAALAQIGSGEPSSLEITAPVVDDSAAPDTVTDTSPEPEPFTYRIGLLSGLSTDNYWKYLGEEPTAWNAYVLGPTKPALYAMDPASVSLVPELLARADGPSSDPDGWWVTLTLRDDVTWSDGASTTAHDLAFTFATVRSLQLGGGWADAFPTTIESISAISDTELRIDFSERPTLAVWPHAVGLAPVMPSHAWTDVLGDIDDADSLYALSSQGDVSGGPLTLLEVGESQVKAEMTGDDRPVTVSYQVYDDEDSAVRSLIANEIDTILTPRGLAPSSVAILGGTEEVTLVESPANAVRYLGFNLNREPMSSQAFRDALALLLDRERIAADLAPGASSAYTVLPPANSAWFDQESASEIMTSLGGSLEQRLAQAIELLEADGYTWEQRPTANGAALQPGTGLTFQGSELAPLTILTPGDLYDPTRPEYAAEIEALLEAIGFDVRPVVTDFDSVVDLAFTPGEDGSRHYDMYLLGWTLGNPALPGYYEPLFSAGGQVNSTGYSSESFEKALQRYQDSLSTVEARNALWEMESILADDKPYLVLYHPEITEAYRSDRISLGLSQVVAGIQGRSGGLGDLIPGD